MKDHGKEWKEMPLGQRSLFQARAQRLAREKGAELAEQRVAVCAAIRVLEQRLQSAQGDQPFAHEGVQAFGI